jgi:hypothetical protein
MTKQHVRCAIYTRKSSEEGLEQSFNSLEAQREACQAFILSQKHEGWAVLTNHYDDGGFCQQIVTGEIITVDQLAQKSGLTQRYVRRILECAKLSPRITEALLAGEHPPNLTLKEILQSVPLNWREQEQRILRSP